MKSSTNEELQLKSSVQFIPNKKNTTFPFNKKKPVHCGMKEKIQTEASIVTFKFPLKISGSGP